MRLAVPHHVHDVRAQRHLQVDAGGEVSVQPRVQQGS